MITIFLLLSIFTSILGAYTMRFQEATLLIGKKLSDDNLMLLTGLQDAITPRLQTIRNILFPILIIIIFVISLTITKWYFAVSIIILIFIILVFIKLAMPKPDSLYFVKIVKNNLAKRLQNYKAKNNLSKIEAIGFIFEKLNKLN